MITNNINGKSYIGQSKNILKRWREHISDDGSSLIHKAILYYGVENFSFNILNICNSEELNDKEIEYISFYNTTVPNGYNIESGGNTTINFGIRSILTDDEIYDIREQYKNLCKKKDVYKIYSNKISYSCFCDLWTGKSRKDIHMDVYTEEIKKYQKNNFDRINHQRKITDDDILNIRTDRNRGKLAKKEVYEKYEYINVNTFNDIWYNRTFVNVQPTIENKRVKNIRPYIDQSGENNPVSLYNNTDVIDIRRRKECGEDIKSVYKDYIYKNGTFSTFKNIWNNKTYKNVIVEEY